MTETRVTQPEGRKQREATGKNLASEGASVLSFLVTSEDSTTFPLYWIKFDAAAVAEESLLASLQEILVDPVYQKGVSFSELNRAELMKGWSEAGFSYWAEKQFLPGVTDNLAHTIAEALALKGLGASGKISVASGQAYLLDTKMDRGIAEQDAQYKLFHPLVETFRIHKLDGTDSSLRPSGCAPLLSFPDVILPEAHKAQTVDLDLSDDELIELSRTRLLALTLEEMKAIAAYFKNKDNQKVRAKVGLSAQPTDVELEVLAQTWSEHCKHKIFNAVIEYTEVAETQVSGGASGKGTGAGLPAA